jgi:hypothetical protein
MTCIMASHAKPRRTKERRRDIISSADSGRFRAKIDFGMSAILEKVGIGDLDLHQLYMPVDDFLVILEYTARTVRAPGLAATNGSTWLMGNHRATAGHPSPQKPASAGFCGVT